MNVSFSAQTHCNCDTCGLRANHGFFAHHDDDLDGEIFLAWLSYEEEGALAC